ncbi:unnamed protein product [Toxocara canis]|uniref:Lipocalin-like domain-containing protein n=1 Tax=Toxocara canis TaxID=6265 RepID=A0A183U2R8_TOXCA|nr:unnamed protein product [Toxocara canis]
MAVFDAQNDGAPLGPRLRETWVYPRKARSPRWYTLGIRSDDENTVTMDDARKQRAYVSHRELALYHYAYRAADKPALVVGSTSPGAAILFEANVAVRLNISRVDTDRVTVETKAMITAELQKRRR